MRLSTAVFALLILPVVACADSEDWGSFMSDVKAGVEKSNQLSRDANKQKIQKVINSGGDSQLIQEYLLKSSEKIRDFRKRCVPFPDNIMVMNDRSTGANPLSLERGKIGQAKTLLNELINPWVEQGFISTKGNISDGTDYQNELEYIWGTYTLTELKYGDDYERFVYYSLPENRKLFLNVSAGYINNANRTASSLYPGSSISCQIGSGHLQVAQDAYTFNNWQLVELTAIISPYQLQWSIGDVGLFLKISNGDMMSSHIRAQFREVSPGEYKAEILSANIGVAVDRSTSKSDKNIKYVQGTRDDTANTIHLNKYYQNQWLDSKPGAKDGACRQLKDKCNITGFFAQLMTDRPFASKVYEQKL